MILAGDSPVTAANPSPSTLSAAPRRRQATIRRDVQIEGVGFVSGANVRICFRPAAVGQGLSFVRVDLAESPRAPARVEFLCRQERRTAVESGGVRVEMTEHVLAALAGLEIDNCTVEIDAGETPAMDGSSLEFVKALREAGRTDQDWPVDPIVIDRPIDVIEGDAEIRVRPTREAGLRVTYELDYENPGIGRQTASFLITPETFERELAGARTFVLAEEVALLRAAGVGLRQTAGDLLVFNPDGTVVDNALRFADECCRHKILDVVGDLALVGRPIVGHVLARRSGHRHTAALARAIAAAYG